jgi:hypothetical protein
VLHFSLIGKQLLVQMTRVPVNQYSAKVEDDRVDHFFISDLAFFPYSTFVIPRNEESSSLRIRHCKVKKILRYRSG